MPRHSSSHDKYSCGWWWGNRPVVWVVSERLVVLGRRWMGRYMWETVMESSEECRLKKRWRWATLLAWGNESCQRLQPTTHLRCIGWIGKDDDFLEKFCRSQSLENFITLPIYFKCLANKITALMMSICSKRRWRMIIRFDQGQLVFAFKYRLCIFLKLTLVLEKRSMVNASFWHWMHKTKIKNKNIFWWTWTPSSKWVKFKNLGGDREEN